MKKLFLGAMAFLVAVTLVACGSKNLSWLSVQTMHHLSSKLW